jgi:uncharacterized protein YoxC
MPTETKPKNNKLFGRELPFELPFDLPELDLPKIDLPEVDAGRVLGLLRDAGYLGVGVVVVTVEKLRDALKSITDDLSSRGKPNTAQLEDLKARVEKLLGDLENRVAGIEDKVDQVVETVEAKLPEQASQLLGQVHDLARSARQQVRDRVRKVA